MPIKIYIKTAKIKHERISKATVGEIKSGVHPAFMKRPEGAALRSQGIEEDITSFTGSKTVGQAVGTTVFVLDEFSRLYHHLIQQVEIGWAQVLGHTI